jgi:hypothetical protein
LARQRPLTILPGMATDFSMLDLMNTALITQGFDDIVAENDGSDEWRLLSRNWPLIVEAELEDGAYFFTRTQVELLSRQDGKFGYDDAYLVPQAAIHVRRLWVETPSGDRDTSLDWVQDGQRVFVNAPEGVFIEYVSVADTSFWSANFASGVQKKLEAVLLRSREALGEAQAMEQQAEMSFQRARTNSSKARSATEPYKPSRFAKARFRRG